MLGENKVVAHTIKAAAAFGISAVLFAATAAPAFADNVAGDGTLDAVNDTSTQDVKVTYTENENAPTVYSVDVTWSGMDSFAVTGANDAQWQPETHTYTEGSGNSWTQDTGTVTVTNHSNANVTAAATYAAEANYTDIQGTFTGNGDGGDASEVLTSGVGLTPENADNEVFTLTLSGNADLPADIATKVGTATITITAAN